LLLLLAGAGGARAAPAQKTEAQERLEEKIAAEESERIQAGLAAAEKQRIADLEALVPWCVEERLFARREALCEEILALDPESVTAHEGLLHERDRSGKWVPPKKKSPAKDYTKSAVAEFEERRAEVDRAFASAVLELVPPPVAGRPPNPWARHAIQRARELVPDHPDLRALLGEQRVGGAWVLDETARARDRRAELEAAVADSLADAPQPRPIEPNQEEAATEVAWTAAVETPWVRVLTTGDAAEAEELARTAHGAVLFFRLVFGCETKLPEGYTLYLLVNEEDRMRFVSRWPTWGPEQLETSAGWQGSGVPESSNAARWDADAVNRLDGAVRHTVGELLRAEFRISMDQAWAFEGFGIYLTRALIGTRRTWYGSPGELDPEEQKELNRLLLTDVDWLEEAYGSMKSGVAPRLAELLRCRLDSMGVGHLLLAHALAAYLIEGEPERLVPLLRAATSRGGTAEAAFAKVLERPLEETEARLERWLGERR
jgi:hypothetical protein